MTEIPEKLQSRLKSCNSLPSVPAVAIRIMELCNLDDVGTAEVATLLARDPALAAKVLKVANSAIYGIRSQITTLDRAIAIMGINTVLSLSLSFSLVKTLRRSGRAGFDHLTFWRRSVITAAASKVLGANAGSGNRDEFFLAGLLQDIGMLVLNETFPDAYGRLIPRAGRKHEKLVALERDAFGTDHGSVGAWLLESWNLPRNFSAAAAASHADKINQPPETESLCKAVLLAGYIAEIWTNPDTAGATGLARQEAIEMVEMAPARFELLLAEVAAALPEITSNLDLEIGSQDTLNRLHDQAREALLVLTLQAQQQARLAQDMAKRDGLTSLYNRSHLEEAVIQIFAVSVRLQQPLSAIFVDVDKFKEINDTYGHQAGDAILIAVGEILRFSTRSADLVARYGGDEFVCLLPNTSEAGAKHVAERIRAAAAALAHQTAPKVDAAITVSQGCATSMPGRPYGSAADLLQAADRCLYDAKRSGRNKVVTAGSIVIGRDAETQGETQSHNAAV
jgi:diguanylate cyclase (GGDEF)-like protein